MSFSIIEMNSSNDLIEQIKRKLIEYHQHIDDLTSAYNKYTDERSKDKVHLLALKFIDAKRTISEIEEILK